MNPWNDYQVPTIPVEMSPGIFGPVRGFTLDDITNLIGAHLDEMMEVATLYVQSQRDVKAGTNMTDIVYVVIRQFPKLISEVISIVTDTPELGDKRLPGGLQFKILEAAFKLTIEDAGGLGNLSAALQSVVDATVASRGEVSRKLKDILSPSSTTVAAKTRAS